MTAALRLQALHVPFGPDTGLQDITLTVDAGECVAVVGASGAGKSTLLRAIAGLAPIRSGKIEISGRDVTALPPERRGAVYLHQSPVLFPHLSVAGNVAFPLRVRNVAAGTAAVRVAEALGRVRLGDLGARRTSALSGGQRHRIALARALVADPPLLLLDEPLSALDPSLRADVRAAIADVRDEGGCGLLLVTHDLDDAALLASRVCVLHAGRIVQDATPAELFARPATLAVARFLDVPNLVEGRIANGAFISALGEWAAPGEGDGPAVAAFRPDALCSAVTGSNALILEVRHLARGVSVIAAVGDQRLEIAVDPALTPSPGDALRFQVRPERIHYLRS
jgi:ABC-type sugar transport system ATPase subunit